MSNIAASEIKALQPLLAERIRFISIQAFFGNVSGNMLSVVAGAILFSSVMVLAGVPIHSCILWLGCLGVLAAAMGYYEWRVRRDGLTMQNAERSLRVREILGALLGASYGWAAFILPVDAGQMPQLFAFVLVASMVTVLTLAYPVFPSYYLMLSLLAMIPLAGHYLYLLWQTSDSFYLLMLVTTFIWTGVVLRKAMFNSRWVAKAIEANVLLTDEMNERNRVEAALRESEEKSRNMASMLRLMCDNVPDMIWAKDMQGRYIFANAALCSQLIQAKDTEEPVGRDDLFFALRERAAFSDNPEWHTFGELCQSSDDIVRSAGKALRFEEFGNVRGKYLCLDVFKAPFINEQGEMIGTVGCGRDSTERKQVELELARYRENLEGLVKERTKELLIAKEAAESANRAKSAFLANMSHEIRTPLNAISGMVFLMQREGVSPTQQERLKKIDVAGKHLLGIIHDILSLSKIEADRMAMESIDVVPADIMAEVADFMAFEAAKKSLSFSRVCDALPSGLRGDPTRIRQALLNYATNAVKFTETGHLTLTCRLVDDNGDGVLLRFEVTDSGPGLSPEVLGRLFSPFEQADNSTTRTHGGTGLGLAITRRIAQLMGGDAGCDSSEGVGSTFWFTARLAKSGVPETTEGAALPGEFSAEKLLRHQFAGRPILLVEDNWINREVMLELLEDMLLSVDIAVDGAEAVERIRENKYDLVLMDIQMPTLDGLAATRQIRAMAGCEALPILAMTANAFEYDRQACIAAGMNDYLAKPVDPQLLFEKLLYWIAQSAIR